jgi:hypothetical protein
LKFDEKPDYDFIRLKLTTMAKREKIDLTNVYLDFLNIENKENNSDNNKQDLENLNKELNQVKCNHLNENCKVMQK